MLMLYCAREGFNASFLSLTSITYSVLAFTQCFVSFAGVCGSFFLLGVMFFNGGHFLFLIPFL